MARPRTVSQSEASLPFGPVRISVAQRAALESWAQRRGLRNVSEAARELFDLAHTILALNRELESNGESPLGTILADAMGEISSPDSQALFAALVERLDSRTPTGTPPAGSSPNPNDSNVHETQAEKATGKGPVRPGRRKGRGR
jgi:hypothetical protein